MMARARGARAQMAMAFEASYGTPPVSGFYKMPFVRSALGAEQQLLESDLLGYGRDPLAPDLDVQVADGDIVVPIDTENFGAWLKAGLGAPSTSGSGTYTHVFASGANALPSMAIEIGMPEASHYAMNQGVMVNSMNFQLQRAGLLTATIGVIAQGEGAPESSTQAGTLSEYDLNRFTQRHGGVTRGGTDLGNVVSANLTYSNELDRIEVIRDDGLLDGLDPSMAKLTGEFVMRYADQTMLDQAVAGTSAAFALTLTRSVSESLTFSIPRAFISRPKLAIEGPQGIEATFTITGARQADGGEMMSVSLVNAVSAY